jgi:hypothetical protein
MNPSSWNPTAALRVATGLLAVPVLCYAFYVAVETAAYSPFPGEDVSRHRFVYLFSALLGGAALLAMACAAVGRVPVRGSSPRRPSTALSATGLVIALMALGMVAVVVLV